MIKLAVKIDKRSTRSIKKAVKTPGGMFRKASCFPGVPVLSFEEQGVKKGEGNTFQTHKKNHGGR